MQFPNLFIEFNDLSGYGCSYPTNSLSGVYPEFLNAPRDLPLHSRRMTIWLRFLFTVEPA